MGDTKPETSAKAFSVHSLASECLSRRHPTSIVLVFIEFQFVTNLPNETQGVGVRRRLLPVTMDREAEHITGGHFKFDSDLGIVV